MQKPATLLRRLCTFASVQPHWQQGMLQTTRTCSQVRAASVLVFHRSDFSTRHIATAQKLPARRKGHERGDIWGR